MKKAPPIAVLCSLAKKWSNGTLRIVVPNQVNDSGFLTDNYCRTINPFIMKILTRLFFCTLVTVFFSCEPEEMPLETENNYRETLPIEVFGDTGGNEGDVIDDKKD